MMEVWLDDGAWRGGWGDGWRGWADVAPRRCQASLRRAVSSHRTPGLGGGGGAGMVGWTLHPRAVRPASAGRCRATALRGLEGGELADSDLGNSSEI